MYQVVLTLLVACLLPFGWADDLYLSSQTPDPSDDCFSGDNDIYCVCETQKAVPEAPAHLPWPDRCPRTLASRGNPPDSSLAAATHFTRLLSGTALLYVLMSLQR